MTVLLFNNINQRPGYTLWDETLRNNVLQSLITESENLLIQIAYSAWYIEVIVYFNIDYYVCKFKTSTT